jgi:hypothetical protein
MYTEDFNFDHLHYAVMNESDLGLLITGAMIMEFALQRILETVLSKVDELELFKDFHVLGPYRAKLDMCRALGLVDKDVWSDLKIINGLRNDAAHLKRGPRLSLSESPFKERIATLREIQVLQSQLHWSLIELLIKLRKVAQPK